MAAPCQKKKKKNKQPAPIGKKRKWENISRGNQYARRYEEDDANGIVRQSESKRKEKIRKKLLFSAPNRREKENNE